MMQTDNNKFVISQGLMIGLIVMIGLGVIGLIGQFITYDDGTRIWGTIMVSNIFILAASLMGVFFIAASTLANAGWFVLIRRVPEAMLTFIPVAVILIMITFAVAGHDIYEWTHGHEGDPILTKKAAYLNEPFFWIRMVAYLVLWSGLAYLIRMASIKEDGEGGTKYFKQGGVLAAIFIVIYAVTSSTSAWDWIMSIDPHWFSTMFGWYTFASMFVTGLSIMTLIVLFLKGQGYLPQVNNEHLHDLGKFMFAFSIFWTYLWFCQFMLIWYANIPEETVYFKTRFDHYFFFFMLTFAINFLLPFLALMTRDSKRQQWTLAFIAIMLCIGHWLDFYLMIMPGVGHHMMGIHDTGLWPTPFDLFLTIGFVGVYGFVVFYFLSKAPLIPKNHPYLEESLTHQT